MLLDEHQKAYIFSIACRCNTPCWNLRYIGISIRVWYDALKHKRLLFQILILGNKTFNFCQQIVLSLFQMLNLLNSYRVNWISKARLACNNKGAKQHLLRVNMAALDIFLLWHPGKCFLSSSNPSLICARRFCSDWIWIWRRSSAFDILKDAPQKKKNMLLILNQWFGIASIKNEPLTRPYHLHHPHHLRRLRELTSSCPFSHRQKAHL